MMTGRTLTLLDYHMHTAVTVDGKMTEAQACEQAMVMGVSEIAFTNHVMLKQPDFLMSRASFVEHCRHIEACRQRYPQLTIRVGIEIDYYPGWDKRVKETLDAYQDAAGVRFDLVMGAIHEMRAIFFSNKLHAPALLGSGDLVGTYREYFTLAADAARCGLFDVLAHPDLIKKHTHEINPPVEFESYRASAETFIDVLLEEGVGMDFNMKGLKSRVAEPFPSLAFMRLYLERARERNIEPILTLGSDAHVAEDVGAGLEFGANFLLAEGQ